MGRSECVSCLILQMILFVDEQQKRRRKNRSGCIEHGSVDVQLTGSERLFRVKVKSIRSAHLPQLKSEHRVLFIQFQGESPFRFR